MLFVFGLCLLGIRPIPDAPVGCPSKNKEGGAGISTTRRLNLVTYSVRERMLVLNTVSSLVSIEDPTPHRRRIFCENIPGRRIDSGARTELEPVVGIYCPEPIVKLEIILLRRIEIGVLRIDPVGIGGA